MPWVVALLCLVVGCASRPAGPDLSALYAGRISQPTQRPVVIIPGLYGSRLEGPDGAAVWGSFGRGGVDIRTDEGKQLLALPVAFGAPLHQLRDEVRATEVLREVKANLFGFTFSPDIYEPMFAGLAVGADRTPVGFAYDWRREMSEGAVALHEFLLEQRESVRADRVARFGEEAVAAAGPIKFDIVGHSTGGLILRYYLMYGPTLVSDLPEDPRPSWAAAELVDLAVMVGPPNEGSLDALRTVLRGDRFSPLVPRYPSEVLQTMPVYWQLVPRAADGTLRSATNPAQFLRSNWAVTTMATATFYTRDNATIDLLTAEASAARRDELWSEHMRKCLAASDRFHAALAVESVLPDGLRMVLFAGDTVPTELVMSVDGRGKLEVLETAPGDGTVTRDSALGRGIDWTRVQFLDADHLGLTHDPAFLDNVLFLMRGQGPTP